MMPTNTVLTLRDLRGEHDARAWTIPWLTRNDGDRDFYWRRAEWLRVLAEAALVAMEWRADDPETERGTILAHDILKSYDSGQGSIHGADCTFIVSREPAGAPL